MYHGYVGGSHYQDKGAAANYLCLPRDPIWGHYEDKKQNSATVYGGEYEFTFKKDMMAFFPDVQGRTNLSEQDAPCAVCSSPRSRLVMVPARNTCHEGWTLEYQGYLSAGRYKHAAATEYVCLDGAPETIVGGTADDNGALFYFVEGRCGSLKCPPYVDGRELTCAVCTK